MKNLRKVASNLLCFTVLILTMACGKQQKVKENEEEKLTKVDTIEKPKGIISLYEAKSLYENYSKELENPGIKQENSVTQTEEAAALKRFVDFDFDDLKNYLDYVKQQAGNTRVTKIRVYFAKEKEESQKDYNASKKTLFMVPTLEQDGLNYGFYIEDGKPKLIKDWDENRGIEEYDNKEKKAKAGFYITNPSTINFYDESSLAYNRGSSGPPPTSDF